MSGIHAPNYNPSDSPDEFTMGNRAKEKDPRGRYGERTSAPTSMAGETAQPAFLHNSPETGGGAGYMPANQGPVPTHRYGPNG